MDQPPGLVETNAPAPDTEVTLNPHAAEFRSRRNNDYDALHQLVQQGQDQQRQLLDAIQLPAAQLQTLDGDPLKYYLFMRLFEANVERSTVDSGSRLTRLIQYCTGKAKNVISGCLAMDPKQGYAQAKALLKSRFGNDYTISEAWIDKVMLGPCLKATDREGLQNMSDDLANCQYTLNAMNCMAEVNNQKTLVKIITRLPSYLQHRWRRDVAVMRRQKAVNPKFEDIVKFVTEAAQEANDPTYGNVTVEPPVKLKADGNKLNRGHTQNRVVMSAVTQSENLSQNANQCLLCSQQHSLFGCQAFKDASVDEQLAVVKQNHLCFNCLKGGHRANACNLNRVCTVPGYGRKHTKFLHRVSSSPATNLLPNASEDQSGQASRSGYVEMSEATGCSVTGAGKRCIALPIVPVLVRNRGTYSEVCTYALLDSGSTNSFCSYELVRQLGSKGEEVSLSLTTLEKADSRVKTTAVSIEVSDLHGGDRLTLPMVYVRETLPVSVQNKADRDDVKQWSHLRGINIPRVSASEVTLLIGQDTPEALMPLEIRKGEIGTNAPYATRTMLGWTLNGPIRHQQQKHAVSSFIQSNENLEGQLEKFWKLDSVPQHVQVEMSVNDRKALSLWEKSITHADDGHYEVSIPFREYPPPLEDNIDVAKQRLARLKTRLVNDEALHAMYTDSMQDLLSRGYAEEVPAEEASPSVVWYLPHHAVLNPNKPGKLRVVFDCSAKHCGKSLNDVVLQGPDLTSKLIGVLLSFRQEQIALMADVEAMFHQVRTSECDRDVLRFLWWRDGKLDEQPTVYRMKVHLFGGVWSPSCCSFVLRRTAEDFRDKYGDEVAETVLSNFYVDDCLKSVDTVERAVHIAHQLIELLNNGGFRLTKWISSSREVMSGIPEEDQLQKVRSLDLQCEALPVERALGVNWDVENDEFSFALKAVNKPLTRRGILSVVSSVYDPLGFLNPFVLLAKRIMQDLCRRKVSWDVSLTASDELLWRQWLADLRILNQLKHSRCFKPPDFGEVVTAELHHFSDASSYGYGAVSYIRQVNREGRVHCAFVISNSRVAPMRETTIPRLELCAAVLSVKLDCMLRHELDIQLSDSMFWTDSTVVLRYIRNEDKRFHTFVANRVATIHESSLPKQWQYVNTDLNPADDVSRGLRAEEMMNSTRWSGGPQFLWQDEKFWPQNPLLADDVTDCDPEVKRSPVVHMTQVNNDGVFDLLFRRRSSWYDLKRDIAHLLRIRQYLCSKTRGRLLPDMAKSLTVAELKNSEREIIKLVQKQVFPQEMKALGDCANESKTITVSKSSNLYRLEPTTAGDGVLRVGGRLQSHPIILPNNHDVTNLIIAHFHNVSGHCGKEYVLAQIRHEYWIIRARTAVRRVLSRCPRCKLRNVKPAVQQMASLPSTRTTPGEPPFSYVGVDLFGPFFVKRGRVQVKRYGCLFTCLKIRAVHIEVVHSLDADSFINALQRFIARRGQVKMLISDNGTNFVGASKELQVAIEKWNTNRIDNFLRQNSIQWKFNPPSASHMGGVWERQIRSVRRILNVLMKEQVVDDESLSTLFCTVESIINNRPLTTVSDDHRDPEPLTPNHLLLMRRSPELPPGEFVKQDCYSRRRWRQVQYLADVFWRRWVRESTYPLYNSDRSGTSQSETLRQVM